MNKISIPKGANSIILGLRYLGHEAYVVGGCVRDSLLGIEPHDWDICTSALPDEVKDYLLRCNIRTVDTGLKHGTITAVLDNGEHYEITTFRLDGNYSDNRHPDSVEFVDSVITDLSRRDFTINAIAFNLSSQIPCLHRGCMVPYCCPGCSRQNQHHPARYHLPKSSRNRLRPTGH